MQIDWITFAAQIVNLFILMWILNKLLYKPVLKVIQDRQDKINAKVREAQDLKQTALRTRKEYEAKTDAFQKERQLLLNKARDEAEALKNTLTEQAALEVERQRQKWAQQMQNEQRAFSNELKKLFSEGFQKLAKQALSDLSSVSLEKAVFQKIKEKMNALPEREKEDFRRLYKETARVLILSDKEPNEEDKKSFSDFMEKFLNSPSPRLVYETDISLVCGIEILCGEKALSWNLKEYLDGFSKQLEETLLNLSKKGEKAELSSKATADKTSPTEEKQTGRKE